MLAARVCLLDETDEVTGRGFISNDEAFTSIELSGHGVPRMTVKRRTEWAEKLGLIQVETSGAGSSTPK